MRFADVDCNFECSWLIELSNKKLFDNNLASELVENCNFYDEFGYHPNLSGYFILHYNVLVYFVTIKLFVLFQNFIQECKLSFKMVHNSFFLQSSCSMSHNYNAKTRNGISFSMQVDPRCKLWNRLLFYVQCLSWLPTGRCKKRILP